MRSGLNVLIIANDPMLAALVGGLVEASRLRAVFLQPGENPEVAVTRVRPLAIVMMEGSAEGAGSELFVARARRRGARVILFGDATSIAPIREWAAELEVGVFQLPDELEELLAELNGAGRQPGLVARRGDRRTPVQRQPDGSLTFEDGTGTRWQVYDRRTGDRRAAGGTREFVSPTGDRRICTVSAGELRNQTPGALAKQLARSVPSDGTSGS